MIRILLVVLTLLALTAGGVFFLLENPDKFKAQISQAVKTNAGYDVQIQGELSWRYWPPIAINVEQVEVAIPGEKAFATFDTLEIDLDLIPLLTGQRALNIKQISVKGGEINLILDHQGIDNWSSREAAPSSPDQTGSQLDEPELIPTIEKLSIEDLSITYTDHQSGASYQVAINAIHTTRLAADTPFDLAASLIFSDKLNGLIVSIDTTGQLQYHSSGDKFSFNNLVTTADIQFGQETYPEINVTTDGEWRGTQRAIVLHRNDIRISSLNITTRGLINLGSEPGFTGVVGVESADPAKLSTDLGIDLPFGTLQIETELAATTAGINFHNLKGIFDSTTFKGSAAVSAGTPTLLTADVRLDQFDTNDYASVDPTGSGPGTARPSVAADPEIIPLSLLQGTHLDLVIRIVELTIDDKTLSAAKVKINNNGKKFDLIANASGFNGKLVLSLVTELQGSINTDVQLSLDKLDVTQLGDLQGITGSLSGHSNLQFEGSMLSHVSQSLTGKTVFTIEDGSLDVRPIKRMAGTIDRLRGKRSSISEWPDILSFKHMVGEHVFNDGLEAGQVLNAELENLTFTAVGGINLARETLRYDVTAMFKKATEGQLKVSDQLVGIRWPMVCRGSFSDEPSELCFGREGAINDLITEVVKQDIKRRGNRELDKLIQDKVPEQYKDLFKNLFKK